MTGSPRLISRPIAWSAASAFASDLALAAAARTEVQGPRPERRADGVDARRRGVDAFRQDDRRYRQDSSATCARVTAKSADGRSRAAWTAWSWRTKADGNRCPGSGQEPGEDLAVASWVPLSTGLTPHGLRHGHKTWIEDQIPDVLKSQRLGHEEPGMRGVYGHVSPTMREELKAALQARWEDSLRQRARLAACSAVPLLGRLLADVRTE